MMAGQDLTNVRDYYCAPRSVGDADTTIYEIWESGGAFDDSITPSTFVPEYRSHVVLKILSLTQNQATIVELTRRKGVDAFTTDFFALTPADVANADGVYADGLIGHLFDPDEGIKPMLAKLADLELRSGSVLVFSNDSPRQPDAPFAPHDRLGGFWFVARDYLADGLTSFGYAVEESYYFPYFRPLSGMRNRTISIARVP